MNAATTVLEGTTLHGDIRGGRHVQVDGRMTGAVEVEGDLVVSASGVLRGDVRARSVRVLGVVIGSIRASNSVEVSDAARVLGDVRAPKVDIAHSASVNGQVARDAGVAETAPIVLGQRPPARARTPLDRPPLAVMPYVGRSAGRMRMQG